MAVIRRNVDIERIQLPTVAEVKSVLIIGQKGLAVDDMVRVERLEDVAGVKQFIEESIGGSSGGGSIGIIDGTKTLQELIDEGKTVFKRGGSGVIITDSDIVLADGVTYSFLDGYGESQAIYPYWFNGVNTISCSGSAHMVFDGAMDIATFASTGGAVNITGVTLTARKLSASAYANSKIITDSPIEVSKIVNLQGDGTNGITTTSNVVYEEIDELSSINGSSSQQLWRTPNDITKQQKWDGFQNPDNVSIVVEEVASEMQATFTNKNTGEDVVYYCEGVRYTQKAGTSQVLNMGDTEGIAWVFLVNGVLTRTTDYTQGQTSVWYGYWDADNKEVIIQIPQEHGVMFPHEVHEWAHNVFGSLVDAPIDNFQLTGFTFGGDGSTDAEYQFARTAGTYRDEDRSYDLNAGSIWAPVFWDDDGKIRRHIPAGTTGDNFDSYLYNAPSGRPYYNSGVVETNGLSEVGEGKYFHVIVFCVGGDLALNNEVSILGGAQYDTLEEARLGTINEFDRTEGSYASLREIGALGVVTFQASDLFTNDRKCKAIEFSSQQKDGLLQPYYDLRNRNRNVLILPEPTPTENFTVINVWNWARYTTFYGACGNNLSTEPNDFSGATTFTIHRNSSDGSNNATELNDFPDNGTFKLEGAGGGVAEVKITGALTDSAQIYSGTIDTVAITGSFSDTESVTVSVLTEGSSTGKFKVTSTDTTEDYADNKISGSNGISVSVNTDVGTGEQTLDIAGQSAGSVQWDSATLESGWTVFSSSAYDLLSKIVGSSFFLDGAIENANGVENNEVIATIGTTFASGYSAGDVFCRYKADGGGYRVGILQINSTTGTIGWSGDTITSPILIVVKGLTSYRDRVN